MTSTVQNTATNQLYNSLINSTATAGSSAGTINQSDFSSLLLMAYSQGVADTQKLSGSALPQATFTPYSVLGTSTAQCACGANGSEEVLGTTASKYTEQELMGKFIKAIIDGDISEGYVKRVFTENGVMYAECNRGNNSNFYVPVNSIVEVKDKGWFPDKKIGTPPESANWRMHKQRGYIEYNADFTKEIGYWIFDRSKWKWNLFLNPEPEPIIERIIETITETVYVEREAGATGETLAEDAAEEGAGAEAQSIGRSGRGSSGETERSGRKKSGRGESAPIEAPAAEQQAETAAQQQAVSGAESAAAESEVKAEVTSEAAGEVADATVESKTEEKPVEKSEEKAEEKPVEKTEENSEEKKESSSDEAA